LSTPEEIRTLFVTTHLPSKDIPQAGQREALKKLEQYENEGPVKVFVVSNTWEASFQTVRDDQWSKHFLSAGTRVVNCLLHPWLPFRIGNRYSARFHRELEQLAKSFKPHRVHYDFTAAGGYFLPGYPSIWKEHDLTYESLRRRVSIEKDPFRKLILRVEAIRMSRWEIRMAERFDVIVTVTEKDRQTLGVMGIDLSKIKVEKVRGTSYHVTGCVRNARKILFFGALNRYENKVSLDWYHKHIHTKLTEVAPEAVLSVVGGGKDSYDWKKFGSSATFHGYVDDPSIEFSTAAFAVAPIVTGAGIKIKVLDYLASGLKVVSTSIGAEGIESPEISIADSPEEFLAKVLELLGHTADGELETVPSVCKVATR